MNGLNRLGDTGKYHALVKISFYFQTRTGSRSILGLPKARCIHRGQNIKSHEIHRGSRNKMYSCSCSRHFVARKESLGGHKRT